jgi:hypothetical protein
MFFTKPAGQPDHRFRKSRFILSDRNNYGVDIEFKLEQEDDRIALYVKQSRLLGAALPD